VIIRGAVIGVLLIAMGLLHLVGNGSGTAVIGAVLLGVSAAAWVLQRVGALPAGRRRR
jgi:hypothetical protein